MIDTIGVSWEKYMKKYVEIRFLFIIRLVYIWNGMYALSLSMLFISLYTRFRGLLYRGR